MIKHFSAGLILIVEDESLLRMELAMALEDIGWTVLEADSGESALSLLAQRPALAALITDIRLGGEVSGWDVAEIARTHNSVLPVIYVSANKPDASRQVGQSSFFAKPLELAKLLPLLVSVSR
jgi:CheY-like chemotaxis protein